MNDDFWAKTPDDIHSKLMANDQSLHPIDATLAVKMYLTTQGVAPDQVIRVCRAKALMIQEPDGVTFGIALAIHDENGGHDANPGDIAGADIWNGLMPTLLASVFGLEAGFDEEKNAPFFVYEGERCYLGNPIDQAMEEWAKELDAHLDVAEPKRPTIKKKPEGDSWW